MIVVHHLNNSRSQRVLWTLEELGVPYEVKRYERDLKTNLAPDSLKKVHPLGKSPVITDGDITVAESGAIIEYLAENYGESSFIPETKSEAYRQYLYWLHFAEGTLMPQLLLKLIFEKIVKGSMPFIIKPIAKGIMKKIMSGYVGPNITNNLDFIENHLKNNQWFAGERLSGADFQMSFPLEAWVVRNKANKNYPEIIAFVKRCQARTAYQKALESGGTYDYA
ncbi:glutathione S-transferase family protein [Colwellia hornerae]|uniref:glutathione transferase n=1 Tax=Colwellia hornerae TaxID=89402 RepID=A0A5C6Q2S8_9GAMM|nr:glutathione S-transferase [Colwellia hornerae]TWX52580.1 glutathione S-transferase [Colwellia hornerae]TWX58343.1 glutathione S-transferase [Colwellia hornerae]TWX63159.1 glutathione S-transferase [Colwellia hornerae]